MANEFREQLRRIAWAELGYFAAQGGLARSLEGAEISDRPTPIHDLNGEELFYRIALRGQNESAGYADIATHPAFGEPLLAVGEGADWNEEELLHKAYEAAFELLGKRAQRLEKATTRFVAYSYPKLAVQFLRKDEELLMLELHSWAPVPEKGRRDDKEDELGLRRQSFLETLDPEQREQGEKAYRERDDRWRKVLGKRYSAGRMSVSSVELLDVARWTFFPLYSTRELHYSKRNSDHKTCYEVRGQETNVWCVGASVQMILDFYRYEYSQTRLAQELGLGTHANPNGLPYARIGDIEATLERMSNNSLSASLITGPSFTDYKNEINGNRPVLSIVPGHARTVAGYYQSNIALMPNPPYKGLLVFDPWPPNAGVVTRWENFNTTSHQYAVRANVTLV